VSVIVMRRQLSGKPSGKKRPFSFPVAIGAAALALAATHFEQDPPEKITSFSAPLNRQYEIAEKQMSLQPVGTLRRLTQMRRNTFEVLATSLRHGRRFCAPRRCYTTLDEGSVEGLDLKRLVEELRAEDWNADSLLVRSMRHTGASDISVWSSPGGEHHMSFGMEMGIPWASIERVESWSRPGGADESHEHSPEQQEEALTAHVEVASDGGLLVDSIASYPHVWEDTVTFNVEFSMNQPFISRMRPSLQVKLQHVGETVQVWIGGNLEWSTPCHFLIRKGMDRGFLLGLRRYSHTLLAELRRRATADRAMAHYDDAAEIAFRHEAAEEKSWWRRLLPGAFVASGTRLLHT